MAAVADLSPRILPRALGAAAPTVHQATVDAAIEFCEETQLIAFVANPMTVQAGVRTYTPTFDTTQLEVSQLHRAWYLGRPLAIPADANVATPHAYLTGEADEPSGTPTDALLSATGDVVLYPSPDATETDALTVKITVVPLRTATELDDVLCSKWADALVNGALYRLLTMRGTNHYDPQEAGRCEIRFRHYINRAKIAARTGAQSGDLRVAMRPLA